MAETGYASENEQFGRYKKSLAQPLITPEQAEKRLSLVKRLLSQGFSKLNFGSGEPHPYIYARQNG